MTVGWSSAWAPVAPSLILSRIWRLLSVWLSEAYLVIVEKRHKLQLAKSRIVSLIVLPMIICRMAKLKSAESPNATLAPQATTC